MIRWAAGRPAVVWATGLSLVLAGGVAFGKLPLATKTRVELPRLSVVTDWVGASPELIETYVTSPIEEAVQSVRGVRKVSSESEDGQSRLEVELDPGTDLTIARLSIHERLELLRTTFPLGSGQPRVSNEVAQELEEQPLMRYTLSGPYTPGALTRIAEEQIEPRVAAVAGVSDVQSFGVAENGVAVAYDPVRLRQLEIDPWLLTEALRNARLVQALGEEHRGANVVTVALRDQPHALRDLEALPIRAASGRVFRLGELASVRPEEDSRGRFYRLNGRTAVGLMVNRLPGADAIQTAARVRAAMAEAAPTLPPGVTYQLENDESEDLAKQLRELMMRGAVAFVSVVLVLAITLRNLTSIWLVMGSAAVAIAGTALGLYLLEIPANLLTLAGLGMGIGVLVQNGIVVVERLRHAPDTPDGRAEAGRRIMPAVVGSTLTTAVVLLPFLYLQGDARAAFLPFAAAFLMGLGWSVFSSLVMIPAVGAGHGLARRQWRPLHRLYTRSVIRVLRWRWATLGVALAALGGVGWGFAKRVPRASFGDWYGQRTTLNVGINFPRGSDPESLDRVLREFESIAVGRSGVRSVVTQGFTGRGFVQVTYEREAGLGPLPSMMQEEMTQRAVFVGGAAISVFGRGPGFFSGGGSASVSFRIKVLGYSYAGVEQLARDLQARLERIPRVREVNINAGSFFSQGRSMSVTLAPDRDALGRANVTVQDFAAAVAREIRGAVGGQRLELEGEEVLVNVKAEGARERSLEELRQAIVPNRSRAPVRVDDLSLLGEREGLSAISREDQQYVRIVSYDFRGPQRLANRTHEAFMASIAPPAGYSVDDERFEWQTDESSRGLWLVFGLGVVLVILSVALVFDSGWAAAMVLLSLPAALGGVGGIFWAAGAAFTREAAVGVILVVGLAVNQAILLVDGAMRRNTVGPGAGADLAAARRERLRVTARDVVWAARDRAGMIMLVTLTTLASLIPLAVGTAADSLFGSIALATAGGTIAGTIGALFITPALLFRRRRTIIKP